MHCKKMMKIIFLKRRLKKHRKYILDKKKKEKKKKKMELREGEGREEVSFLERLSSLGF